MKKLKRHPVTYYFDKEKRTLGKSNSSTMRQYPYTPGIHKIGTKLETGYREVVTRKHRRLTIQETKLIQEEYQEELNKRKKNF